MVEWISLIGGGIGGSFITFSLGWLRDRRFKKREEFMQLARQRVESISKAMYTHRWYLAPCRLYRCQCSFMVLP